VGVETAAKRGPRGRLAGVSGGDVFDLDFLKDVYAARYETDAGGLRLFIHRAESEQAAAGLLRRYEVFFEEFGEIVWRDENPSRQIVAGEVAGEIDVVFVRGRYLGGVSGAEDIEAAKTAAREFFEGLEERMKNGVLP